MAEQPPEAPKPSADGPVMPICPYCNLDPCLPDMIDATYGNLIVKIFCCPNRECRRVFNVEAVGERRSRVVGPSGHPV